MRKLNDENVREKVYSIASGFLLLQVHALQENMAGGVFHFLMLILSNFN